LSPGSAFVMPKTPTISGRIRLLWTSCSQVKNLCASRISG